MTIHTDHCLASAEAQRRVNGHVACGLGLHVTRDVAALAVRVNTSFSGSRSKRTRNMLKTLGSVFKDDPFRRVLVSQSTAPR